MNEENDSDFDWKTDLFPSQKVKDWTKSLSSSKDIDAVPQSSSSNIPLSSKQEVSLNNVNATREMEVSPSSPPASTSSASQGRPGWLDDLVAASRQSQDSSAKEMAPPSPQIDSKESEPITPLPTTLSDHLPLPGSIMRNLHNTRKHDVEAISLQEEKNLYIPQPLSLQEVTPVNAMLPRSEEASIAKPLSDSVSTTDILIQMPPLTPLAPPNARRKGKAWYTLLVVGLVVGLLIGSIGAMLFAQQLQNPTVQIKPTVTAIIDNDIDGTTTARSTVTPGRKSTASPNATTTPSSGNTPQTQPTSVPTKGVTPVATQKPVQAVQYKCTFEDGQLEGWEPRNSPSLTVQNSTAMAKEGSHSLVVTFSTVSPGYPHLSTTPGADAPYAGQTISAYVYVAAGGSVQGRMYVLDQQSDNYHPGENLALLPNNTWVRLSYVIPSNFPGIALRVGLEFNGQNATVYIDAVNWG